MLYELYTSLTTRCPHYVRHMDYLSEAVAMRGRYLHNRSSWQSHLDHTRRSVLSAAEHCPDRGKAVVLGAGLLLDVPLEELSSLFREVVLLDIVFVPEIRKRAERYNNVKLVQHDVTQVAERLYENILRGCTELPLSAPRVPEIDEHTNLVISLNILSQLWVIPRSYGLKKLRGLDEEQVDDWCRQIVEAQYTFLRSLPCSVCLIADHEFIKRDREGRIVSQASTLYGLELPEPDAFWTWNIMPRGEDRHALSKELKVGRWQFP